jgi:hypothetical protein
MEGVQLSQRFEKHEWEDHLGVDVREVCKNAMLLRKMKTMQRQHA